MVENKPTININKDLSLEKKAIAPFGKEQKLPQMVNILKGWL